MKITVNKLLEHSLRCCYNVLANSVCWLSSIGMGKDKTHIISTIYEISFLNLLMNVRLKMWVDVCVYF